MIWYEHLFEVIHEAHLHLAHARDSRTHKTHIDQMWWVVTEDAIKIYRGICPECLQKTQPVIPENLQQLQFIFSVTIGSYARVDLIDSSRRPDEPFKWVLHYVDHHSGFAHVDCLPNKEAITVGKSLLNILATAVIPEILQSDNGGEFTAWCIEQIERHYPTIHIVNGHLKFPQSQGCIEQGNGPFKEALDVWISQNPGGSWAEVGAFVVNGQINGRPQLWHLQPYRHHKARLSIFLVL